MVITDSLTGKAPAILFIILFSSISVYLFASMIIQKSESRKMSKAATLINEGHNKALQGKKDDGFYSEQKKLKHELKENMEEDDRLCEAQKMAQNDMQQLK